MNELVKRDELNIKDLIYNINGLEVMLDRDLAFLYQVETKRINEAVRRNKEKFTDDYSFVLSDVEINVLWSQNATANINSKSRVKPRVFTKLIKKSIAPYILSTASFYAIMMQIKGGMMQMRKFDLISEANSLINNNIVNLLLAIHEYKGKQNLYIEAKPDILSSLLSIARIQSTSSSNKIEGIYTTDQRLSEIVNNKIEPKNRNEEEIAGYRDVLATIHENYDYIDINKNIILQLHRDLYKYSSINYGGKFKNSQNYIEETLEDGSKKIRFVPLSAVETPLAIEELCNSYNEVINKGKIDPLLVIPIFILDFVSIHPFNDGNGRMSRLLTLLLLYRAGYIVGKYISLEKIIEETKETYYDSLEKSSVNWHTNENDYSYFVEYYLGIILAAYKDFSSKVEYITNKKMTAIERISIIFMESISPINKSYLMERCPDISETTIERTLNSLLNDNKIEKISGGRFTEYKWIDNK